VAEAHQTAMEAPGDVGGVREAALQALSAPLSWRTAVSDELPVTCPACGNRFEPFLRFQVGRRPWPWWNLLCLGPPRPFLALICWACKEIVGYE
jgi:hypothetical protein